MSSHSLTLLTIRAPRKLHSPHLYLMLISYLRMNTSFSHQQVKLLNNGINMTKVFCIPL